MMENKEAPHFYYVYILTNKVKTVLYVGMTENLKLRLQKHKQSIELGEDHFTARYNTCYLLYFEEFKSLQQAMAREKEVKKWNRLKKVTLIRSTNPSFQFLEL